MDRRSVIKNAGIAGVLAAGIAPAVHAQAAIRWRLASSFPKPLDAIYGATELFASVVKAMSGGKFEISVHAAGELMPAFGVVDGVQQGSVEACHTVPYYFYGKHPAFALGSAIPFGLSARQMSAWMTHGNGRKLMNEFYASYGMRSFAGGNTGAQMGGWFRKEIKSVEDLKGLKFRISGLGGQVLMRMGVVPQQLGIGDIYPSLERGTIDAAEFNGPADDEKLGLFKVAPHYYYPGFWDGTSMQHFFINSAEWDKLPKHYQAALQSAAALANIDSVARYDTLNPPALRRLVAAGAKLHAFPNDVLDAAYTAAMELYEELSAQNPTFKKFYESQKAFQRDASLWNQVSEFAYDSTIIRQLRR